MSDAGRAAPAIQWRTLSIDCANADQLADFYSKMLGWDVERRGDVNPDTGESGWVTVRNPAGGVRLAFAAAEWYQPPTWPEEPAALTKMMHFEIAVHDLEASIALVEASGGSVAPHQPPDRDPSSLRIMLDPAGHPFCFFTLS